VSEPALPEKVSALDRQLTEAHIPHAFGGALALAYYAEPRTTIDIDLNIFVAPTEHSPVATAFSKLGVDAKTDRRVLERDGQCRIWWGRTPLDLFYAYDELHAAMAKAVRRVPFADGRIPILSPEHLIVCKASYDRPKDWLDIEQMVAIVNGLDVSTIRADLDRILGPENQGTRRFDGLVRDLSA